MNLFKYEDKLVRVTDINGYEFTGVAETFPSGYGLHEFNREEECIEIGDYVIFASDIEKVEFLPTLEEAEAAIPPGIYRHFKGNEYEVMGIARHSETGETMVVYKALYGEGGIWVRPASMWNETVERDGQKFKRFSRLDERFT